MVSMVRGRWRLAVMDIAVPVIEVSQRICEKRAGNAPLYIAFFSRKNNIISGVPSPSCTLCSHLSLPPIVK
jgi:hypothetical protein